jgi:hypothetical protein
MKAYRVKCGNFAAAAAPIMIELASMMVWVTVGQGDDI